MSAVVISYVALSGIAFVLWALLLIGIRRKQEKSKKVFLDIFKLKEEEVLGDGNTLRGIKMVKDVAVILLFITTLSGIMMLFCHVIKGSEDALSRAFQEIFIISYPGTLLSLPAWHLLSEIGKIFASTRTSHETGNSSAPQSTNCFQGLLEKELRSRAFMRNLNVAMALIFLLGFSFLPYMVGGAKRWLLLLIHFLIPVIDVSLSVAYFSCIKKLLIQGTQCKYESSHHSEKRCRAMERYNGLYAFHEIVVGLGFPALLTLAVLKAAPILLFVWAFLGVHTIIATMEHMAIKALQEYV